MVHLLYCFVVLINVSPSIFFFASRGLRQGYPLSPFFLIVVESLSKLLLVAKREGKIKGLSFSEYLTISHLLFVYGILLFFHNSLREMTNLKEIIELFCNATGMEINMHRSSIPTYEVQEEER